MPRKTIKPTATRRKPKQFLNDPHILVLLPRIHTMSHHDGTVTLMRPCGESMRCSWRKLEKALVKFYDENF